MLIAPLEGSTALPAYLSQPQRLLQLPFLVTGRESPADTQRAWPGPERPAPQTPSTRRGCVHGHSWTAAPS